MNLVMLNGVIGALSEDAIDNEDEILFRLGKSGKKIHAQLTAVGLSMGLVCRTVKEAALSPEVPSLNEPPWTEFPGRSFILRRLETSAVGWTGASQATRRKILLKAITSGIAQAHMEKPDEELASFAESQPSPASTRSAPVNEVKLTPEDLRQLNLAVLNGAIGSLSEKALRSDEAIRSRLDEKQGLLLQKGLRAFGLTLSGLCMFVKSAATLDTAPHFDEDMWLEFPATNAIRKILASSAVGWSAAKEVSRRKTLLKAISEAIGTHGSKDLELNDDGVVLKPPEGPRKQSLIIDKQSLSLIEDLRERVQGPVGVDELLLAGILGLTEFEDEELVDLISEVREMRDS